MSPFLRRLALGLYIITAILVFGYLLFPAAPIQNYIENRLGEFFPHYQVTMEDLKPRLPLGIKLTKMNLYHHNTQLLADVDLILKPTWRALLGSRRSFNFTGRLHQGSVQGTFGIQNGSQVSTSNLKSEFRGIDLTTIPGLAPWRELLVSGSVEGRIRYDQPGEQASLGAQITFRDLTLNLDIPVEKLDHLMFTGVTIDLQANGPKLEIRQSRFSGPQGEGQITGTVGLSKPVADSTLSLTGHFKPNPALIMQLQGTLWGDMLTARRTQAQAGYPFQIRGRLNSPQWQLR